MIEGWWIGLCIVLGAFVIGAALDGVAREISGIANRLQEVNVKVGEVVVNTKSR